MLHDLFPTKIYMNLVSNYEKIQEEFKAVADDMEWQNLWNTHLVSDNQFQDNLIKQYNLTTFEDELRTHIVSYVKEINSNDDPTVSYKITASWMTKYTKDHYAMCHEHGWSDVAGVYYFQTDENDGNIYFQTPNVAQTTCFWDSRPNIKVYPPEQGGLILFPGWLRHGTEKNTTDHTRISVSFNLTFDRDWKSK